MKRFQIISRLASAAAAVAMVFGAATVTSCSDDDDEVNTSTTILATPANLTSSNVTDDEATFSWDAVSGAYTYLAEITQITSSPSPDKRIIIEHPVTTVTFVDLESGSKYYFRVTAMDEHSEGRNSYPSEWITITTNTVDPTLPQLATPQNVIVNEDKTTENSLTFRWDPVEYAESYTYRLTDPNNNARTGVIALADLTIEGTTNSITVTLGGLEKGTTYSFQLRANPADEAPQHNSSAYSIAVSATTLAPLAAPVASFDVATTTSLRFTWDAVEYANSYDYTYRAEGGQWEEEINVTSLSVTIPELTDGITYYFKVRAVPADGSVVYTPSAYSEEVSGTTISANAIALDTPQPASTNVDTQSITVEWASVPNAAKYVYVWEDEGIEKETTETTITRSGLDSNTEYTIKVKAVAAEGQSAYSDSEYSASLTARTANASGSETVSTVAELKSAITNIASGGTIYVQPGTYIITDEGGDLSSIDITKSMFIEGTDATNRPYINAAGIKIDAAIDNFSIQNIEFTAYKIDAAGNMLTGNVDNITNSNFIEITGSNVVQNLTIDNCYVHDLVYGIVRAYQGASTSSLATNVTMTNNLFINIKGPNGQMINARDKTIDGGEWIIRNNTVTGIGVYGLDTPVKTRIIGLPYGPNFKATISNNTFYDIFSADNSIDNSQTTADGGAVKIEKNIFYFNTAVGTVSKGPRVGSNTGNLTDSNCVWFQNNAFSAWTSLTPKDTNMVNEDPQFVNTDTSSSNFNFKATNASVAGWGDARWQ